MRGFNFLKINDNMSYKQVRNRVEIYAILGYTTYVLLFLLCWTLFH